MTTTIINPSFDARIRFSDSGGQDFSTMHNQASGTAFSKTPAGAQFCHIDSDTITDLYDQFFRLFFTWDTSPSDDADVVSAGKIRAVATSKQDEFTEGGSHSYVASTQADPLDISNSDFDQFGTSLLAVNKTIASYVADDATFNEQALNAAGIAHIDLTGDSVFCAMSSFDEQNAEPTWASSSQSGIRMWMKDASDPNDAPELSYDHAPPAGSILIPRRTNDLLVARF